MKDAQSAGNHPVGAASGEVKRTQLAFFGNGNGKSGLVSDGMLNTGGMSHFGDKKNWELISGSWVSKAVADQFTTEVEEHEAQAVKHFEWLSRVGNNHKLMKNYTSYFSKGTEVLLKFLQAVRVRLLTSTHCFVPHACMLQGLEINALALSKIFVRDFVGHSRGVAYLENLVFVQHLPLPKGAISEYAGLIQSMLNYSNKNGDVSATALQSKATYLYSVAAFSLRDEILSKQLSTLVVQLSTMAQFLSGVIGIRFPALIKAHALTDAFSKLDSNTSLADQNTARAKLKRDVAGIFSNLPAVNDVCTYDVPPIVSVGLSTKVIAGNAPALVQYKDMFAASNTLPEDGPPSLFAAALAMGLESKWFPEPLINNTS